VSTGSDDVLWNTVNSLSSNHNQNLLVKAICAAAMPAAGCCAKVLVVSISAAAAENRADRPQGFVDSPNGFA